jgi:predicted permease
MRVLRSLRLWVRSLCRRSQSEANLNDELQDYIARQTERHIASGLSPENAHRAALRDADGIEQVKENCRDARGTAWLENTLHDIRFGFRTMRKHRTFAITAALTLSAGIGAATTMFSVLYGVLIDPFPYTDAKRLVLISIFDQKKPGEMGRRRELAPNEDRMFESQTNVFEGFVSSEPQIGYLQHGGMERPTALIAVSGNTFPFMGIPAKLGRPLLPRDERSGAAPVAVISEGAWQTLYGGDPRIVGMTVSLNRQLRTIVGIIPKRYAWFNGEFWIPLPPESESQANVNTRYVQGRLKPGVTLEQANQQLTAAGMRLKQIYPQKYPDAFEVRGVYCLDDLVSGAFRRTLYTLSGAVFLLLLIASSNVASLLLARATARSTEIGLRLALGAGRSRIVRQLLAENVSLAVCGGALGCLVAFLGVHALQMVLPQGTFANESVIEINFPVLLFSIALSIATVFLFGLAPAWQLARQHQLDSLRITSKGSGDQGRNAWLSETFVGAQAALTVVLMVGAGLFIRSFVDMLRTDVYGDPRKIAVAFPIPSLGTQLKDIPVAALLEQYELRLRGMPGVIAAGRTTSLPGRNANLLTKVEISTAPDRETISAALSFDTEGVASACGYTMLAGRWISNSDISHKRRVAVVNDSFARASFGNAGAIGRSFRLPDLPGSSESEYEITGVVADVRNTSLRQPAAPMIHLPQVANTLSWVVIRSAGDVQPVLARIPKELEKVTPLLTIGFSETLEARLDHELAPQRFALAILSVFAITGLAMVMVGLYGAMSYAVSRRTYELGIRKALGAGLADIFREVTLRGLRTVVAGAFMGTIASLFASQLISNQLGHVSRFDFVTYSLTIVVLLVAAGIGMAVPTVSAILLDPLRSLRHE